MFFSRIPARPPRPAARLRFEALEARETPAGLRVALVSSAVAQAVAAAAEAGVVVAVYDAATTDTAGLVGLVADISAANGGAAVGELALVAHGSAGRVAVGAGVSWGGRRLEHGRCVGPPPRPVGPGRPARPVRLRRGRRPGRGRLHP